MFIKIVRNREFESLYECARYHFSPHDISGVDDGNHFTIGLEGPKSESVEMTFARNTQDELAIYVMNDAGKTIDTLWRNY